MEVAGLSSQIAEDRIKRRLFVVSDCCLTIWLTLRSWVLPETGPLQISSSSSNPGPPMAGSL